MVVVITFILDGSMGPQSPIFSLNHYSRPYGERNKFFLNIFVLFNFALSVYQCFVMFVINISTNWQSIYYWHYASVRGINVAGLGRPCASSVVLICSMCMSFLELTHFFIAHFIYLMHASTCPLPLVVV